MVSYFYQYFYWILSVIFYMHEAFLTFNFFRHSKIFQILQFADLIVLIGFILGTIVNNC